MEGWGLPSICFLSYICRRKNLGDVLPQTPEDLMNLSEQYTELENGTQFLVSAEQLTEDGVALVFISDFGN